MDPIGCAAGSGGVEFSAAVKQSGANDAWAAEPMEEEVKDGLDTEEGEGVLSELSRRTRRAYDLQAPITTRTHDLITVLAITEPNQGSRTSSHSPPSMQ